MFGIIIPYIAFIRDKMIENKKIFAFVCVVAASARDCGCPRGMGMKFNEFMGALRKEIPHVCLLAGEEHY